MFSDTGRKGERQSKGGNAASFLTAIDAIYAAADNARLWPIALQSLADFFGARGASMSWSSKGAFVSRVSSQALQQAMDNYLAEGWRLKDLRRIRIAQKGLGSTHRAFTDHDLCSADEIRTAPIYTQWCARFDLGWFAAKFVNPDAKLIVGVSVHRSSATRPPFNDDELANLESFAAHIQRALRFNLHKIDAEVFQSALSELFSRLDICVIAINSTAQVVLAVDEGMSLLGDGIALVDGHLSISDPAARAELLAQVDRATARAKFERSNAPRPILIQRKTQAEPLVAYVLPAGGRHEGNSAPFLPYTCAFVLIIDSRAAPPASAAQVSALLGLTLGESRLAALVASGLSPSDAAHKLNITTESARTILKRVFQKTNISRQNQLAARLGRLVVRELTDGSSQSANVGLQCR